MGLAAPVQASENSRYGGPFGPCTLRAGRINEIPLGMPLTPTLLLVPSVSAGQILLRRLAREKRATAAIFATRPKDLALKMAEGKCHALGLLAWQGGHGALLSAKLLASHPELLEPGLPEAPVARVLPGRSRICARPESGRPRSGGWRSAARVRKTGRGSSGSRRSTSATRPRSSRSSSTRPACSPRPKPRRPRFSPAPPSSAPWSRSRLLRDP